MRSMKWSYECEGASGYKMHHWKRQDDGTAKCNLCDIELTVEEADECFESKWEGVK